MKTYFILVLTLFFNTRSWSTSNDSNTVNITATNPLEEYNIYRKANTSLQYINLKKMKKNLSLASRMGYNFFESQAFNDYGVPDNLIYPLYEFLNNEVERKSQELTSPGEESKKTHNLRKRVRKIDIEIKSTSNMDENCREIFNDKKTK